MTTLPLRSTINGMSGFPSFQLTIYIGVPASQVWHALTAKESIDRFYLAPLLRLELRPGGPIEYGQHTPLVAGVITALEAPTQLSHTFRFVGGDEPESNVTYEITPVGDAMCRLTITHEDLLPEGQTAANVTTGWPVIASGLKTLLETGAPLPWPKA